MADVSVAQWEKTSRDTARKLLFLHGKLDGALLPGGSTSDVVNLQVTKEELALLMAAIEQSL